jgi:hypothetical protein
MFKVENPTRAIEDTVHAYNILLYGLATEDGNITFAQAYSRLSPAEQDIVESLLNGGASRATWDGSVEFTQEEGLAAANNARTSTSSYAGAVTRYIESVLPKGDAPPLVDHNAWPNAPQMREILERRGVPQFLSQKGVMSQVEIARKRNLSKLEVEKIFEDKGFYELPESHRYNRAAVEELLDKIEQAVKDGDASAVQQAADSVFDLVRPPQGSSLADAEIDPRRAAALARSAFDCATRALGGGDVRKEMVGVAWAIIGLRAIHGFDDDPINFGTGLTTDEIFS